MKLMPKKLICIEKDKFFINYDDNLDKTKKDISKHLQEKGAHF